MKACERVVWRCTSVVRGLVDSVAVRRAAQALTPPDDTSAIRREQFKASAIRSVEAVDQLAALLLEATRRLDPEKASIGDVCDLLEAACVLEQHAFRLARASTPRPSSSSTQRLSHPQTKETS